MNPADEKAVAEFRRPCRYNGVFDDEGPCCCSACDLHEFALTVAARIRAEAERETEQMRKALTACDAALSEIMLATADQTSIRDRSSPMIGLINAALRLSRAALAAKEGT